ncbi:MAG: nucleotidyltransferase [Candidatus Binatia bacterium]
MTAPGKDASRLIDALKAGSEILEEQGVEHALLGGLAANLYRKEVRATQDVDFGIRASPIETIAVVDAFSRGGWAPELRADKAEALRLTHDALPRIDLLIAGTPFEKNAIARAVPLTIDGHQLTIVTPEDLIVYKLVAGRARDYDAVGAILNAAAEIDSSYVAGWLEQFGVSDRWQQALEEARKLAEDES